MKRSPWLITGAMALAILLLGGIAALEWLYSTNLSAADPKQTKTQVVEIRSGDSSRQIAQMLDRQGLVKNALAFQWYLYRHAISWQIQTGLYRFAPNQPAPVIASMLASGETAAETLTIKGGDRLSQIIKKLQALNLNSQDIAKALRQDYRYSVLKDKPAKASLIGYLFPDTYRVHQDATAEQIIDLILANTERKVSAPIRKAWATRGLNIHEGLTLASIVQQEVGQPSGQRKVAQVFYSRLKKGIKLESDVTFIYAGYLLNTRSSPDLKSAYNTYLHHGLPPGPIASVELPALQAVANPAPTHYLYFIADKEGKMHFSTTAAGHRRNIDRYLR